ncbi:hypothetical protein HRS9139_07103 [Pyrenophora teres f. teres]|nr:hypothetical protein HRS9139_07103 [Pyrenophora teres f. teres]
MDHWGDPWADNNADQAKSTPKQEVIGPEPPTLTSAPVLTSAFLDDAGWGNEDAGFGGWATPSGIDAPVAVATDTRIAEQTSLDVGAAAADSPRWDTNEGAEDAFSRVADTWVEEHKDVLELDNVTSDTSETSTTIQPDQEPVQDAIAPEKSPQADDDSSPRISRTPSDTSHHEAPVESSRTSFEEEGGAKRHSIETSSFQEDDTTLKDGSGDGHGSSSSSGSESAEGEYGTSTEDTLLTEVPLNKDDAAQEDTGTSQADAEEKPVSSTPPPPTESSLSTVAESKSTHACEPDATLLDELFPPLAAAKELDDAPDDPIYSVSSRKAWYRLTRNETMREFNLGKDHDNYVRVTWAGSQVRTEVNKIVGRWAREDRLSGKGPGARASFYWDTVAPVDPQPKGHLRTKTSVPTPRPAAPIRQSLPPVSANTPVAFAWSTSPTTVDPWRLDSPSIDAIASHIAPKPIADNSQTHELGTLSMDLPRNLEETAGKASTKTTETPAVATVIPPPIASTTSADSWADFSTLDTNPPAESLNANDSIDDDEDWGEMISTPTVFTPTTELPSSVPAPHEDTPSTLAPTPETPPNHTDSAEEMHAASIVRLRTTISPTSAVFGQKSFIPLHAEVGPIGPGILKPAKQRVVSITASAPTKNEEVLFKLGPELLKKETRFKPAPQAVEKEAPAKSAQEVVKKGTPSKPAPEVVKEAPSKPEPDVIQKDEIQALDAFTIEPQTQEPILDTTEDDDFSAFVTNTSQPLTSRPITPPPAAPPIPTIEPTIDAWADVDFSFFESSIPAPAPAQKSSSYSTTTPPHTTRNSTDLYALFEARPRSTSAASSAKTFTRSPPRSVTPPPIKPLTGATNSAQRRKNEEEGVLRGILDGLPDLRYMLR